MKRTILFFTVLLFSGGLFAQGSLYQPLRGFLTNTQGKYLYGQSFLISTVDTVDIPIGNAGSLSVGVQTLDSAHVLMSWAVSYNDTTFTAYTLQDSLQQGGDGSVYKSLDLTSYILGGVQRIRVIFKFSGSALGGKVGTTTPTYSETYEKKSQ